MPWGILPRRPDFIIGTGSANGEYLHRWWIVPRNKWFNFYLHKIIRSDDDRALHDHPWWNLSVILAGGYYEIVPRDPGSFDAASAGHRRVWRAPGSIVLRPARAAHRLEVGPKPCWSLFVTGPRVRNWGFHCPKGWVHWERFVNPSDTGRVGPGCDG